MAPPPICWLSEKLQWDSFHDPDFTYKIVDLYKKFSFKNITAEIGDFVLISNADAADPDTVEGCDIGQIIKLYESHDKDLRDRYRAHVQWFCKSSQMPASTLKNANVILNADIEIVEDHRPFDKDVSIETFYKKCNVVKLPTTAIIDKTVKMAKIPTFFCRYRITALTKRKFSLEPVLDDERKEFAPNRNMITPKKSTSKYNKIGTPTSLIKKMESASIHDHGEWVVKQSGVSKLTLMRDITNKQPSNAIYRTPSSRKSLVFSDDLDDVQKIESPSVRRSIRPHKPNVNYLENSFELENLQIREENEVKYSKATTPKRQRKPIVKDDFSDDDFVSTPKKEKLTMTPRTKRLQDDDFISTPKKEKLTMTPRTKRIQDDDFVSTPKKEKLPMTPKTKRIQKDNLTPSICSRKIPVQIQDGALQIARESLHVSSVPLSLPCREQEFNNIFSFIEGKISDNLGGCMYISGVPGTGKTATVTEVIKCLHKQVKLEELPEFEFIEINGMRLTEPRQAYVQIYKQLTGKTVAWEQACNLLEARFTKPAPRRCTTVLLVDELDVLCNKRQDVLYNLLDWPSKPVAHLIVVAIANTMDLPERLLMGRVASRLGLTRLTFQPYNHSQLQNIVTARLSDTGAFNADAVQLVARKVAAVSGDARRALDICRRAVELAEVSEKETGITTQVSLLHVNQALVEMIASPKIQAIKSCSKMEQIFLQATAAEIQRTGIEETLFYLIHKQLQTICAFLGCKTPSITESLRLCCHLGSSRLIICDNSKNDIYQKVLLNISPDDVHYATQNILN